MAVLDGMPSSGTLPQGWRVSKLKRVAKLVTGITPSTENRAYYAEDGPFGWATPEDLDESGKPLQPSRRLSSAGWAVVRPVTAGSTLVCCIGSIGKLGFIDKACSTNQQVTAVQPHEHARFMFYALTAQRPQLETLAVGNVLRILNTERLGEVVIPFPPFSAQTAIAAFLDREIAKIDALIAKQEQLIATLREDRTATITQAVTKGLDPEVKVRQSGVDWCGEIPDTWQIRPIKAVAEIFGRIGFRGYTTADIVGPGEGAITLGPGNFTAMGLDTSHCTYLSWEKYFESPEIMVNPGDILIVKTGSTYGKVALADADPELKLTVNPQIAVLKNIRISPKFLAYVLSTPGIEGRFRSNLTGGSIPTMTQESVRNTPIPCPPARDQRDIVAYIDSRCSILDATMLKAEQVMTTLREYRSALITDAVTGKIDVRGVA